MIAVSDGVFVFSSRRRHTRCALVTGVQTCALPISVSDVVRMTLTRVAKDHALPFELKVPNAETRAAIEASRATMKARRARFTDPQEVFDALDQEARQQ